MLYTYRYTYIAFALMLVTSAYFTFIAYPFGLWVVGEGTLLQAFTWQLTHFGWMHYLGDFGMIGAILYFFPLSLPVFLGLFFSSVALMLPLVLWMPPHGTLITLLSGGHTARIGGSSGLFFVYAIYAIYRWWGKEQNASFFAFVVGAKLLWDLAAVISLDLFHYRLPEPLNAGLQYGATPMVSLHLIGALLSAFWVGVDALLSARFSKEESTKDA